MHCLSFWVYKLHKAPRRRLYHVSPNPAFDAYFWQEGGGGQVEVLTPPLDLASALTLADELQKHSGKKRRQGKLLAKVCRGWHDPAAGGPVQPLDHWQGWQEIGPLHDLLRGRILLLAEVEQAVASARLHLTTPLVELLHCLFLEGKLQCRPAVQLNPLRCLRCGGHDLQPAPCLECGSDPVYTCQSCSYMGLAKSCTPIYACSSPELEQGRPPSLELKLPAALTLGQRAAAGQLGQFLKSRTFDKCLFWAVCGAGKTEAALVAVAAVLRRGGRVLWAAPRRDIVVELAPRISQALAGVETGVLHGHSKERFSYAPLIIATTHQALRLYAAFDLVILDEVDAFPYVDNPMLELALERALKPGGKLINLTATPTPKLLTAVRRGQMQEVLLPIRWHGHPLPEPEIRLLRLPAGDRVPWPPPQLLLDILNTSLKENLRLLIYVPSVQLAEEVGQSLAAYFCEQGRAGLVQYIHAADGQRDVKRGEFFAGKYPILVTTTLLERGITLPRLDLVVLYAHHSRIFSEAVLMQIAGRAGRAAEYPRGRVYFLGEETSPAMLAAQRQIQRLNRAARKIRNESKEDEEDVES